MGARLTPIVIEGPSSIAAHMRQAGMIVRTPPHKHAIMTTALPSEYDNKFRELKEKGVKFVFVCGGETETHGSFAPPFSDRNPCPLQSKSS